MVLNPCDDARSSWLNQYGCLEYISIVWWLLSLYSSIDASTGIYEEEEENIYEEEEEHFDQYTNQGKLLPWASYYHEQAITMSKLIPMQALLVQDSKDTLAIYFI